jgi:hypothetical protein
MLTLCHPDGLSLVVASIINRIIDSFLLDSQSRRKA